MNKIAIITDSSSCMDSKMQKEFNVLDILPMHITFLGQDYDCNGDWTMFDPHEYYDHMRNGALGKSQLINQKQYLDSFKRFLDQGYDILSISCTGALSASVKESYKARDELAPLYPNQKIYCVDSANCTYTLTMIIKEVSEMIQNGATIEDVVKWIDDNKLFYQEVGTVEKLSYLRAAGRISASAAFFGGLLSIKPIVVYDEVGHNVAIEKVKGRAKSFETIAGYVAKYGWLDKNNNVYIAHADCLDDAKSVAELIQAKFENKLNFHFGFIEPGVGSSVGPGGIIVCFYGSPAIRGLNK